jgi:hypothetical protein
MAGLWLSFRKGMLTYIWVSGYQEIRWWISGHQGLRDGTGKEVLPDILNSDHLRPDNLLS